MNGTAGAPGVAAANQPINQRSAHRATLGTAARGATMALRIGCGTAGDQTRWPTVRGLVMDGIGTGMVNKRRLRAPLQSLLQSLLLQLLSAISLQKRGPLKFVSTYQLFPTNLS